MARDDCVEIQLQRSVQSLGPFKKAASLCVVDIDIYAPWPGRRGRFACSCASQKKVSGVYDLEIRKEDDGVAVGVTSSEILCSNLLPAEVYRELIRKCDPGQSDGRAWRVLIIGLLDVFEVSSYVSMCDDVRDGKHLEIAAGMIVVLMGIDNVLYRLVGNRLYLSQNVGVVSIEHVVDEHHSFHSDVRRDISTFSRNQVQLVSDSFHAERPGLFRILRVDDPRALQKKNRSENLNERCPPHAEDYISNSKYILQRTLSWTPAVRPGC